VNSSFGFLDFVLPSFLVLMKFPHQNLRPFLEDFLPLIFFNNSAGDEVPFLNERYAFVSGRPFFPLVKGLFPEYVGLFRFSSAFSVAALFQIYGEIFSRPFFFPPKSGKALPPFFHPTPFFFSNSLDPQFSVFPFLTR